MRTIPLHSLEENPNLYQEIGTALLEGGLVCLPCGPSYRVVADLMSEEAVQKLLQSKRRTQKAPGLVFVGDVSMLCQVTEEVCPLRKLLMQKYWPGPLTILFTPHPDLPKKVIKPLLKSNGKLGVRIPDYPLVQRLVHAIGRPILVSSANPERKHGANSAAQVRKNFNGRVDVFIDAGDLQPAPASTVIDVVDGQLSLTREGALAFADITRFLQPQA
jgi:L-threonylcarbamoyladenylate synthase